MSDLFGNHIVGFPTRRLIYNKKIKFVEMRKVHGFHIICMMILKGLREHQKSARKYKSSSTRQIPQYSNTNKDTGNTRGKLSSEMQETFIRAFTS